jgi:hypothetical protein
MRERLPLSAVYKKKQKAKKKGSEKDDTGIRTRDLALTRADATSS